MKENQAVTRGIANKGFSGMRRFEAITNFSCNLVGNHPQSFTGHTNSYLCRKKVEKIFHLHANLWKRVKF